MKVDATKGKSLLGFFKKQFFIFILLTLAGTLAFKYRADWGERFPLHHKKTIDLSKESLDAINLYLPVIAKGLTEFYNWHIAPVRKPAVVLRNVSNGEIVTVGFSED
jgi:hypothetical protein